MSGYARYDNLSDSIDTYNIPIIPANNETFKQYGKLITDYNNEEVIIEKWPTTGRPLVDGTGIGGGITEGEFIYRQVDNLFTAENKAVLGNYIIGITYDNGDHVLTREANYHPDGGQVFYSLDKKSFILVLALPGDDVKLEDFVGFYFDGHTGCQIFPNVWHQPVFPTDNGNGNFMTKQGKVHACVKIDFLEEFGKLLKIKLK